VVKSAGKGIERNKVRRRTGVLLGRPGKRGRSSISAKPQDPISTIVIILVGIAAPPKASTKVRQR
jgi:hypothetical protein